MLIVQTQEGEMAIRHVTAIGAVLLLASPLMSCSGVDPEDEDGLETVAEVQQPLPHCWYETGGSYHTHTFSWCLAQCRTDYEVWDHWPIGTSATIPYGQCTNTATWWCAAREATLFEACWGYGQW